MPVLRIYNRYAVAEIFGGLVGWPALLIFAYVVWFGGYVPEFVDQWGRIILVLWMIGGPFWIAYDAYKALFRTAQWVDFGKRIHIYRLLRKETLDWDQVDKFLFDNEPVTMSSGLEFVDITVAHEKFLRLIDRHGRQLARLRIDKVDRAKLLERMRKQSMNEK